MEDIVAGLTATVMTGPMLAALPVALLAGLVSFASPCVLPLLPGYVGYFGGMSGATTAAAAGRRSAGRLTLGVGLFVLGFTAVFVLLGVAFGTVGQLLVRWEDVLMRVLGVVVILLGLAFSGYVPFLQRARRPQVSPRAGLWGAPLLGAVFGLGWTPCIGPTLAAVLTLSLDAASAARGAVLAVAYGLGLGVPFLLFAVLFSRSSRALAFLRRHRVTIARLGGGLLVVVGLAMVTGVWSVIAGHLQGLVADFQTVI